MPIDDLAQMLLGAAELLITKPFSGGITAWLCTTFMVFVVLPVGVGMIFEIVGAKIPTLHFDHRAQWWFKWCVRKPIVALWHILEASRRWFWRNMFRPLLQGFGRGIRYIYRQLNYRRRYGIWMP
ncbi:MAG: hypothetical protein UU48_C0001G0153 [Candidatus Uhrbacteria bacterium GW2011_GWF2_41_16]|uniref:Uncharacterized protein n=2 Tax=Candidatus Uhriibacteriota TaxID=1752732 RepID=A0A0G0VD24_9BACT|nr:MAG: hypothetical protein UU35_C0001G0140 [Candidatus Uhrbacteria bacterium GW2011_GWC2_41_11]KKR98798.1 MAG: hypothetical protein UU48_C0001G0153 [Candidatus Uhrbacteria bacterium GW2011_GWF2_41_16]